MDYRYGCNTDGGNSFGIEIDEKKAVDAVMEVLDGVSRCLGVLGLEMPDDSRADRPDLMLAAVPGKPVQVVDAETAYDILTCLGIGEETDDTPIPGLSMAYDPDEVLALGDQEYLAGPAIFLRTEGHSDGSVTAYDAYLVQDMVKKMEATLCADGKDFPAFRLG